MAVGGGFSSEFSQSRGWASDFFFLPDFEREGELAVARGR